MKSRLFAKVVPALVAAGLLLGAPTTAEAAPSATVTTQPVQTAQGPGSAEASTALRSTAPRAAHGATLASGDKKDEKKKGGFFKKLGIAVLVVILLIVLFAIGLLVAIVLAIRAIFRRRRTA
ncbi:hypothetical protein ACFP3U_24405 [Kitasatospora misakiensis]|uniref:Uncharacterized protein n=1 Tax=Kitasatospora misakiensis TaxID=67330 RepID=A0ABW0X8A8_9ACTN